MPQLTMATYLPYRREEVYAWCERPGALTRLMPPGFGRVTTEYQQGVRPKSEAKLRVNLPGFSVPASHLPSLSCTLRRLDEQPPHRITDQIQLGSSNPWHFEREFFVDGDATTVVERLHYENPKSARVLGITGTVRRRLNRLFAYRRRVMATDLAFHSQYSMNPKTFLIAGSSGLIGSQLVAFLRAGGHQVRRLVRRPGPPADDEIAWDPSARVLNPETFADVDVVINLAGHPIAGHFTRAHLGRVRTSRVAATELLADRLRQCTVDGRLRALINASASGYYGPDRGDEVLSEMASSGRGVLADIVQHWEDATVTAADNGIRVALARTGIVQSPAGGQLGTQLPFFLFGLGGPLGHGRQWVPWVAIDDIVRAYAFMALTDSHGPFNVCAPILVTGDEYARILAEVVRRSHLLRVPKFGLAAMLGKRGAVELALAGQRMSSQRLVEAGFRFVYQELRDGLAHVLASDTTEHNVDL